MKLFHSLLVALQLLVNPTNAVYSKDVLDTPNGCITFSVGPGTGCAWMCNHCSTELGTNNFILKMVYVHMFQVDVSVLLKLE